MYRSKPTDFAQALSDFLFQYLPVQKGLSENTIKSYSDAFSLFLDFCESELHIKRENVRIEDIHRETVECFLDWLESERHSSIGSRNQRRAALSSFFRYLQYKNPGHVLLFQQIRSIPRKAGKCQPIKHLSLTAIETIFKQPDLCNAAGRRDFAILCLMYELAARVSEVTALSIGDVRFARGGTTVYLYGKGRKSREVPLIGDVSVFVKRYIADESSRRHCQSHEPLFCNRSKDKLTRAGVAYILNKYVQMARDELPELYPEKVTPHIFRHSRAMHWLEAGVDLQYIKDLLGHADLVTTEVYAQLNTEMKRKILEAAQPASAPALFPDTNSWTEDKNLMGWLKSFNAN